MRPEILLKCFVEHHCEDALRDLVLGSLNLVYSTALRLADGYSPIAQTVSETVFGDLAQQARRLPVNFQVSPWLHRRTCLAAGDSLRKADRCVKSQGNLMQLQSPADLTWENLRRLLRALDKAILHLRTADREAIIFRYLEQQDLPELAELRGGTESVWGARLARGLEQMRNRLARRRILISIAALQDVMSNHMILAAPPGLAIRVSQTATFTALRKPNLAAIMKPEWLTPEHVKLATGAALAAWLLWVHPGFRRPAAMVRSGVFMTPMGFAQLAKPGEDDAVPLPAAQVSGVSAEP